MNNINLLVVVALIIMWLCKNNNEGFDGRYGWHCMDCKKKSINQCVQCANCGFSLGVDGHAKCVQGDMYGPYDKSIKSRMWYHSDPYARSLFYDPNKIEKPYEK